jgi:hypothetical protein
MKTYGGVKVVAPLFLTSVIDGDEWSASHTYSFIPRERAPYAHCLGGWVGLGASLDYVEKSKIFCPCQESNPKLWAIQPVAILTELSQLYTYKV